MPDELSVDLPVGTPAAHGYQFFAFPLAILATDDRTTDWILSNFIQVEYDVRGWECDVPFTFYLYDYATSPWLEVVRATRRWGTGNGIRELLRDGLDRRYYLYTIVDEWYVPRRRWHGVRHYPHDVLVHGVDDRSGTFSILGFDERMRFTSTSVSQTDFERAYASLDGLGVTNAPVLFYRLRTEPEYGYPPIEYALNLDLIRQTVDEYVRSVDTSRHFQMLRQPRPCVYGMDTYDHLEAFIRSHAAGTVEYDIRHLHLLWEHKRLMTARIHRIADLVAPAASLEKGAHEVETIARTLRDEMIRDHLQGGRAGYLDRSLRMLETMRAREHEVLSKLLVCLDDREEPYRAVG